MIEAVEVLTPMVGTLLVRHWEFPEPRSTVIGRKRRGLSLSLKNVPPRPAL